MHPKYVPDPVAEKFNRTSLDNSSGALNKVWPDLAYGKKPGVKPGSNIKADKTHKYWHLACEAYQKPASQNISRKSISFLNYSHCVAFFNGTKS